VPTRRAATALPLLLLLSWLVPAVGEAEETVLTFERRSRTFTHLPAGRGGPVVSDSTQAEILVVLGDRRMAIYEAEAVWVYDFEKRRVLRVDPKTATYSDWSLFAFVAFKEMELGHRLGLRARLPAGRAGPVPSVLDLETLFSMRAEGARPGRRESLADSSRGGQLRFFTNGALAMWAIPSQTTLAPPRQAAFEHFLLHRCPMHPAARQALARAGKVPALLFYRYLDFQEETQVVLTLKGVASAPEANDPAAGARRVDVPDPSHANLARLLAARRACGARPDRSWVEASLRFERESLAQRRYLDAALASAERSVASELAREAHGDAALAAWESSLQWSDSAGARQAAERLQGIDGRRLEKAYVLALAAGRARMAAGDVAGGSRLLSLAVGGNPCLAAAWQELARAYLAAYEPVLAWICFDAARELAPPGCSARSEGERLERALLQRHPEFFE
jgi:hypothetical protein